MLTPTEYYKKITDYSEEGKQLNYIMAYYSLECEANIIMKIGFGTGKLKRDDQFTGSHMQRSGIPYILKAGRHWTPKVPYDNPGSFITFSWFKNNVICADQSWICGKSQNIYRRTRRWWQGFFGRQPSFEVEQN